MALLLIVAACGGAGGKSTLTMIDKCNATPGREWRVAYTEHWTTQEPVYEYYYDWLAGEWKYGQNGTETVEHSRDVYACVERR